MEHLPVAQRSRTASSALQNTSVVYPCSQSATRCAEEIAGSLQRFCSISSALLPSGCCRGLAARQHRSGGCDNSGKRIAKEDRPSSYVLQAFHIDQHSEMTPDIWYSMDLPRDDFYRDPNVRDVDIEVYSIVRPTTSGYHQTLFILQPPAAVLEDISNPARRQRLIEVPYRIHTNIMETALGRWAEMINKMSSDMIIGVRMPKNFQLSSSLLK